MLIWFIISSMEKPFQHWVSIVITQGGTIWRPAFTGPPIGNKIQWGAGGRRLLARDFCKAAPNSSSRRLFLASFLFFHRRRLTKSDWNFSAFQMLLWQHFIVLCFCIEPKAFHPQGEAFIFYNIWILNFINDFVFDLFWISGSAIINFNYSLSFCIAEGFFSSRRSLYLLKPIITIVSISSLRGIR